MRVDRKAATSASAMRLVLTGTIALVLAIATFLLTAGFMPGAGFGFRTANARAVALTTSLDLASDRARVTAQMADARAIVARDATDVGGVRSLAILSDEIGQPAKSVELLNLAERLSRRDALTEIALIEVAVAHGSIDEALRHYDRALTTNPNVADTLVPVLVAAASNAAVAQPLASMMVRRPVWWPRLLDGMIATGQPGPTAQVARSLALRPEQATEGWRLSAVIDKLARTGHADVALRLARQVRPGLTGSRVDGDFERTGDLAPFDWALVDSEGLAAVREQRDGADGRFALSLIASSGQAGVVARRLLLLPAGRYTLHLRAGELSGDPAGRPKIALRCAANGGAVLADTSIDRPAVSVPATIPQGCPGQWLEVSIAGASLETGKTPWIDDVALEPAS